MAKERPSKECEEEPLLRADSVLSDVEVVRIRPTRLIVVEPVLILYALAGFPLASVHEQYFLRKVGYNMGIDYDNLTTDSNKTCSSVANDTGYLQREAVQGAAALWKLYITIACFIPGIFSKIVIGTICDRIGRRIAFLLPPIGGMFLAILYLGIIHFELSINFFFLEVFERLFGGMNLLFVGAFAYLADTTSRKWLAVRLTIIDVVIFFSGGLSDLGVGYFIKFTGYAWPLVFVVCGKFVTFLYAFFFIPETIAKVNEKSKAINDAETPEHAEPSRKQINLKDYLSAFRLFLFDNGSGRRWKLCLLSATYFIHSIYSTSSILTLFEQNTPLCWDSVMLGYFSTVRTVVMGFGTLAGMGFKRWLHAVWLMAIGKLSSTAEYVALLLANNTISMFSVPVLGCMAILPLPMMRSIMSSYVGLNEQASLFAALACISDVCSLVGSLMVDNMYKASLLWYPRFVFAVALVLHVIGLLLVMLFAYLTRADRQRESEEKTVVNDQPGDIKA